MNTELIQAPDLQFNPSPTLAVWPLVDIYLQTADCWLLIYFIPLGDFGFVCPNNPAGKLPTSAGGAELSLKM